MSYLIKPSPATPVYADATQQKAVFNQGPGKLYYSTTSDTNSEDTEVGVGSSATLTATQFFIAEAAKQAKLSVMDINSPTFEDVTVSDDLTVSGKATVAETLGVTGATTATGGVAGGKPFNAATWQPIAATSGTDTACTEGTAYVGAVFLPANATVTGISYLIGSVGGTNKVIASLHDSAGAVLANSAVAGATVGTAANVQAVNFTAPFAAKGPAFYFVAVTFDGTTAKFRTVPAFTQTFGTVAAFTAPTAFTADKVPVAFLH